MADVDEGESLFKEASAANDYALNEVQQISTRMARDAARLAELRGVLHVASGQMSSANACIIETAHEACLHEESGEGEHEGETSAKRQRR